MSTMNNYTNAYNNNIMNSCNATFPPTSRKKEIFHNTRESEKKFPVISYTNQSMILLKSAMKNSMEKNGGMEVVTAANVPNIRNSTTLPP
ncbi:hypothetical protein L195_g062259, partial [Trifolium pratense]